METIPQDVAEAVRVAADAARGYPGTLADVHRRARRRRDRQVALSAAAVVAVLAAAGFGATVRRERPSPAPASSAVAPRFAEQRLMMDDAAGRYRALPGTTVDLGADTRVGELLPGGRVVPHPVVGARAWDRAVGLPGGGVVAAGPADRAVQGGDYRLVVTGADGTIRVQREIGRGPDELVFLLTATETTAYLWRPAALVAHDLATGAEKPVITAAAIDVPNAFDPMLQAADLAGDRLAVALQQDGCAVSVIDDSAGRKRTRLPLDDHCQSVIGVRLSPDGSMFAASYRDRGTLFGVVVIRIADGAVLARGGGLAIETSLGVDPFDPDRLPPLVALAWRDGRRVHGVSYQAGGDATYDMSQFTLSW